jgi:glucuronate isomerase
MSKPLELHPDRLLGIDPNVRTVARRLFDAAADLPLVCPHGHVSPALLANDEPFEEPSSLIVTPDHYILRLLYSQGIPMEALGVRSREGKPVETDPRAIWQTFADHYYLFHGTPTRAWLDFELREVLGIRTRLDSDSARPIYDEIASRLAEPAFRPRALFERFRIEVLTTTDAASDSLEHHQAIRASDWPGRVLPCFRPDALLRVASPAWRTNVELLAEASGMEIFDYRSFIAALENRREYFRANGATSTDVAVEIPRTGRLSEEEAEAVFERALGGKAATDDQAQFEAHMLMEMARMSVEDGLVMQLHAGSRRNHNDLLFHRFGPDRGADIPVASEYTRNLRELLNAYGNDPRLTLVLFTLDESAYSRELAPIAGHYPSVRLGPPWWFHDSIEGMKRYRRLTTETAGIYNTAGFNDDTRAFLSIPARHDLARRMDANYLATLVARHQIDEEDAHSMMRALSYDLARETYRLDRAPSG